MEHGSHCIQSMKNTVQKIINANMEGLDNY